MISDRHARNLDGLHIVQRQSLAVLGGPGLSSTASSSTSSSDRLDLTSILGGVTSIFQSSATSVSSSSTVPTTTRTTSSSTTTAASVLPKTTTSSTTPTSTLTSTSTSSHDTTSLPLTSNGPSITVISTSAGLTVTVVEQVPTSSTSSVPTGTPVSFLQNKPLAGGVFALVGIVALVLCFIIVTMAMRKRRHGRLQREIADAVSFDPIIPDRDRYEDEDSRVNIAEKYRFSGGSSGHGHGSGGYTRPTYAAPSQGYYGGDYGQQPITHAPPPPQMAYNNYNNTQTGLTRAPTDPYSGYSNTQTSLTRAPSDQHSKSSNQGGLTRSPSGRKPVPPLLPEAVYDPSHTQLPRFARSPSPPSVNAYPGAPGLSPVSLSYGDAPHGNVTKSYQ